MTRGTKDGRRVYLTPEGESLVSVTTILDRTKPEEKKQALENWRKRVGEQQAQQITKEAANRGTRMHTYLENYVRNGDMTDYPDNPYAQSSWYMAAEVILKGFQNVDEFWGIEVPVYYTGLYAGTTDCIGVWKGRPAIIDFKQTNKPKKREWIDDYFMQLAAYSQAHDNMHGTNIDQGVILMACQPTSLADQTYTTPEYLEFEVSGDEFLHWKNEWNRRVEQYYQITDNYK